MKVTSLLALFASLLVAIAVAAASWGGEGEFSSGNEVVAECGNSGDSDSEASCSNILQRIIEAHCGFKTTDERDSKLKQIKEDVARETRLCLEHGPTCMGMARAGLKAFDDDARILGLLETGSISLKMWRVVAGMAFYSAQLAYLSRAGGQDEEARIALAKVMQQVSDLSIPLARFAGDARGSLDDSLTRMKEAVVQLDPTLDLSLLESLAAGDGMEGADWPVDQDEPVVLKLTRRKFLGLDDGLKKELTEGLKAREWDELLQNWWVGGADNAARLYYTLEYGEARRLAMLEEAMETGLERLVASMCDPAYVPRMPEVMGLLEGGLDRYPHLRSYILPTIYQLGYAVTKWHFAKEDLKTRSEERRVWKECLRLCRSRWSPYH